MLIMSTLERPSSADHGPSESGRVESAPASEAPEIKTERIAGVRHELAELHKQLLEAQQRIATELQGRAEDADRFEELETRMHDQELKAAARAAELIFESEGLRARLESTGKTIDDLRRDLEARDARIEQLAKQSSELTDQLASQTSSLRDAAAAREAELATRTSERDSEQATRQRLERELEELQGKNRELGELIASTASERETQQSTKARLEGERDEAIGKQREITEQFEKQTTALREAAKSLAERDAELTARTAERDALLAAKAQLEGELDETRRALEGGRAKAQELAKQLTSFGNDMLDTVVAADPRVIQAVRAAWPPPPPIKPPPIPGSAPAERAPSEALAIRETAAFPAEPETTNGRTRWLIPVLGIVAICAVSSVAVVQLKGPRAASTAGKPQEADRTPGAATEADERSLQPGATATVQPLSSVDDGVSEQRDAGAPSGATSTEGEHTGVIVLPAEADGRRVWVDGRRAAVKNLRVEVPCGSREVQVGSSGEPRVLEVACEGETEFRN